MLQKHLVYVNSFAYSFFLTLCLTVLLLSTTSYGSQKKFHVGYAIGRGSQCYNFLNPSYRAKVLAYTECFLEYSTAEVYTENSEVLSPSLDEYENSESFYSSKTVEEKVRENVTKQLQELNEFRQDLRARIMEPPRSSSLKIHNIITLGYQLSPYLSCGVQYQTLKANNQIEHVWGMTDNCSNVKIDQSATIHNVLFLTKGIWPIPKLLTHFYVQGGLGWLFGDETKMLMDETKLNEHRWKHIPRHQEDDIPHSLVLALGAGSHIQLSTHWQVDFSYLHLFVPGLHNRFRLGSIGLRYCFNF